jgi:hypothetical protein
LIFSTSTPSITNTMNRPLTHAMSSNTSSLNRLDCEMYDNIEDLFFDHNLKSCVKIFYEESSRHQDPRPTLMSKSQSLPRLSSSHMNSNLSKSQALPKSSTLKAESSHSVIPKYLQQTSKTKEVLASYEDQGAAIISKQTRRAPVHREDDVWCRRLETTHYRSSITVDDWIHNQLIILIIIC